MKRKKQKRVITKSGHFERYLISYVCKAIFKQAVVAPQGERPGILTIEQVIDGFKFYSYFQGETEERYKIALCQLDEKFGIWRIYYDAKKERICVE